MKRERNFHIADIDCIITIEIAKAQKEVFAWLDDSIDLVSEDDCFEILYKDGSVDIIDSDYDGHRIRRNNIASMVYSNPSTYIVYGNFEMNEFGCVYASFAEVLPEFNVEEI